MREARTLLLRAGRVDYTLVRRRGRRGVGLKVDATGLTVSAPLTVPVARIEKMVLESESWVLGKLEVWRQRQVPVQRWEDGAALPYLGGELALRLRAARRALAEVSGNELLVAVPSPDEEAIRRAVVAWYRRAAQRSTVDDASSGFSAIGCERIRGLPWHPNPTGDLRLVIRSSGVFASTGRWFRPTRVGREPTGRLGSRNPCW